MLSLMRPVWLVLGMAAGAAIAIQGCGGGSFSVATNVDGSPEAAGGGTPDATLDGDQDAELGPDTGEASNMDAGAPDADATVPDEASQDAQTEDAKDATEPQDAALEGSPNDAPNGTTSDAEWVPDVIQPSPGHCNNGFTCAPSAPDGWSGPLEVYAGPTPPAACSANFEGPVFVGGSAPAGGPATCGCSCMPPEGVGCAPINVPIFCGVSCSDAGAVSQEVFSPAVCAQVDVTSACDGGFNSMIVPASAPTAGKCSPAPTKTATPPTWSVAVRACISGLGAQASDCAAGDVCTHLPLPPFSDVCIAQAGVVAECPAGRYTSRRIYDESFADSRDCAACTCGGVTGASCKSQLEVFATTGPTAACQGAAQVTYPAPASCSFVQQPGDFLLQAGVTTLGSCSASPPAPIGALTGAQPTTFCCLP